MGVKAGHYNNNLKKKLHAFETNTHMRLLNIKYKHMKTNLFVKKEILKTIALRYYHE